MPRRLLLALLLLVAAPLVLLGWVSASTMASAQQLAQTQLAALLRSRLSEIDGSAIRVFDRYTRELTLQINESDDVITDLRRMRRTSPIVRQGLFVSSTGQLLHPAKPNPDDADAVALYAALPGMISGRSDLETVGDRPRSQQASKSRQPSDSTAQRVLSQRILEAKVAANNLSTKKRMAGAPDKPFTATPQWQIWYLDRGIQLILWIPRPDGTAVGVLLDRPRWTADLTAELPDSQTSSVNDPNQSGFTALVDESKQIVYRWGAETLRRDPPTASIAMSSPLSGWQWEFHSADPLVPRFSMLPIVASLAGIGVLLIGLGGYVLSSVQRQMRSARNRVSFAGQVSHELRTPLTNIRLYAELAQSDLESLPESKPQASLTKRLGVIESESKRLSRLVSGVLEMIRDGKRPHGPRLERHCPDELINETLQQFAPSFQQAQITVHCDLDAPQGVDLDADLFEMVLVNLLSNAEKYAAAGEYVGVRSRIQDDTLIVSVQDRGPGIPKRHRAKIFQPFARLDNSISAPSGTGIGLTIATNAARRHGGTLRLVPSDSGSLFELRIPVQANPAEPTTQPPGEA